MGQIIKDAITGRKKTIIQGDKVYDAITGRQVGFFKDGYYVSFSTGRNQSYVSVSGPDLSGVTATPEDVAAGKYFINSNSELLEGSLGIASVDVQDNLVIIEPGIIRDRMTVTVTGGGSNSGPDMSDATVTAGTLLNNIIAYGKDGSRVVGSIPTVTPELSGNVVTVPAGYIAEKQTLTVAEMAEPSLSANVVTIGKGYNKAQKTLTVPEAGELSVADNVVTVPVGYIKSARTATVAVATAPTTSGNVVTVNKGYQSTQKKITVGTSVAAKTYTPGTADQAIAAGSYLAGKQTIKGYANLIAENIADGVTIFGVAGTHQGGGGSIDFYECTNYTPDFAGGLEYSFTLSGASKEEANGTYIRKKWVDPIDESSEDYTTTAKWVNENNCTLTEEYGYGEYTYSIYDSSNNQIYTQDGPNWSRVTDYNQVIWADTDDWMQVTLNFSEHQTTELPPTTEAWSGYKMLQNTESGAWSKSNEFAADMPVLHQKPKVGEIYSADTSIRVRKMYDAVAIPIITDGLVFYAPLQSDYEDRISSESASVTSGEFAKYNEVDCVKLDGSGFIQWINNNSIPAGKAAYSMVLKVAPTRLSGWSVFLSMGQINDTQNSIRSNSTYLQGSSQGKLTLNTWQTLVLTRNEGGGSGSVYLNGVLAATSSGGAFAGGDISTPAEIMVGAETANGGNDRSSGYFAHAAIYNRVLSAAEVLEIHNTLMDM